MKGNKKLLSIKVFFVLLAVFVLLGSLYNFRGTLDSLSAIYGSVLVNLANRERLSINTAELKVNPLLELAAQMKADDMATKGYFAHNTPEGKTPWYWVELAGYDYIYAGENLAVNFTDSNDIHTAWKNSRGHFLNIINPKFEEIGIATSTGTYKGREAVFVVQMFGTSKK